MKVLVDNVAEAWAVIGLVLSLSLLESWCGCRCCNFGRELPARLELAFALAVAITLSDRRATDRAHDLRLLSH